MKPWVVDMFAGPGGWDTGLAMLGHYDVIGIDNSPDACATAVAAGHARICTDLAELDPYDIPPARGIIASPPCQGFSTAGAGVGRGDRPAILSAVAHMGANRPHAVMAELRATCADPRSALVLEPLHWALAMRPTWLAWEQVPAVGVLWRACAVLLRAYGYSVWTGAVHAEQYGVPQTRTRAVLLARHGRHDVIPRPTHRRYRKGSSQSEGDPALSPWVSMADALGCDRTGHMVGGGLANATVRRMDEPAATVVGGHGTAARQWVPVFVDQSGTVVDKSWPTKRPSTTVAGRDLVQHPGATANRFNGATKSRNDGVRVSVAEAATLQSFPDDYPWHGNLTSRYQQVGDAMPPLMAQALLRNVV